MRSLFFIFPLLVFCLVIPATALCLHIDFGIVTGTDSAQYMGALKFKEIVEAESEGKITVTVYHSGSVGSEARILNKLRKNYLQMGLVTGGAFSSYDNLVGVLTYPFLFSDYNQADRVLGGKAGNEILESLKFNGFKGFAFTENGFRNIANSVHPVTRPEDLEDLKLRVMDTPLEVEIWEKLGANPLPLPWPIDNAFKSGAINAQENPLWVLDLFPGKWYISLTNHVYSPHIFVSGLDWWQKMDRRDKETVQKAITEAAAWEKIEIRKKNREALDSLKKKGATVVEKPDLKAFRKKAEAISGLPYFQKKSVKNLLTEIQKQAR